MKQIVKKAGVITMSAALVCASFAPLASADTMPQTDTKLAVSKSSKTKDILYTNKKLGFSLTLPASWKGKYVVVEDKDSVSFRVYYNNKKNYYDVLIIFVSKHRADYEHEEEPRIATKKGMDYRYMCNYGDPDSYLLQHPQILEMIRKMTAEDAKKVVKTFRFLK